MTWLKSLDAYGYAILWVVPSLMALAEGWRLSATDTKGNWLAGQGGYITLIGVALMGFALYEIGSVSSRRANHQAAPDVVGTGDKSSGRVWKAALILGAYVLLVPHLGFILGTGLYLLASLRLLGCSRLTVAATVVASCLLTYLVLPPLGISVPRGPLGF